MNIESILKCTRTEAFLESHRKPLSIASLSHLPSNITLQKYGHKISRKNMKNQPQQRCDFPSLGNITSIQNRRYLLMLSVSSSTWSFRHPFRGQHGLPVSGGLSTPQLGVNFSDSWAFFMPTWEQVNQIVHTEISCLPLYLRNGQAREKQVFPANSS